MNAQYFGVLLLLFSYSSELSAQSWTTDVFGQKVFIENRGQFNEYLQNDSAKILFQSRLEGLEAYFTTKGITYKHHKWVPLTPEEEETLKASEQRKEEEEEKEKKKIVPHYMSVEWVGCNPHPKVIAEEPVDFYYTYGGDGIAANTTTKANAYKKITYKDIYPHIDLEYIFPENKGGIKYSLILHPGADPAAIKMKYSNKAIGSESAGLGNPAMSLNADGNVIIKSSFGDFTDHAPKTFYKNGTAIESSFELAGNVVSFNLKSTVLNNETIIIDPWTTNPAFTPTNKAYDINYDMYGNVYVYGSDKPYQLAKLNSAGNIQWVYNAVNLGYTPYGYYYGDFALDEITGTSYLVEGYGHLHPARVFKVNTLGLQTGTCPGASGWNEMWRAEYNRCLNKIVIGGGSTIGDYQGAMLDTALAPPVAVNFLSASGGGCNDVAMLAVDNSGFCYMATSKSSCSSNPALFDNVIVRCPIPNLVPISFSVPGNHKLAETSSPSYILTNGMNGMALSANWLYTYNGDSLKRWNKLTGALVTKIDVVPLPPQFNIYGQLKVSWGGISIDACDNIYVGAIKSIKVYNSSMVLINTLPASDTIYDIKIGPDKIYFCGKGFVSQLDLPDNTVTISSNPPSSCTVCDGTASAILPSCVNGSAYTYSWAPTGQTTQTVSGLCVGDYTVTASSSATTNCVNSTGFSSATVTIAAGSLSTSVTATPSGCISNIGTATATIISGASPYTYLWSNSETNASISGLGSGTYSVTITDGEGCTKMQMVTVASGGSVTVTASSTPTGCTTSTGTATANASNGTAPYTYAWNNGQAAQTATGLGAGTYTATATDALGCTNTQTITVVSSGTVNVTASSTPTGCTTSTGTATANASNGTAPYTYLWDNGQVTQTATGLAAGTYTTTVTDAAGCTKTQTVMVISSGTVNVAISSTPTGCTTSTGTATANASSGTAPYTYLWDNGQTTQTATGLGAGTYTAMVTDEAGCTKTQTATIISVNTLSLSTTSTETGCNLSTGTATANASSGTPGYAYLWDNGESTQTITGLVAGAYTVTIIDAAGCTKTQTVSVTQTPASPATASAALTSILPGESTTLSANTGNAYQWSPSGTLSCDTCQSTIATPTGNTIYCVTVTDVNNCTATGCVTITAAIDCSAETDLYLPNAFSPNGDSENDALRAYFKDASCLKEFNIVIYNRWGENVFESSDVTFAWDGTYNGRVEATSVFVYSMNATFISGGKISRQGNVSLIR